MKSLLLQLQGLLKTISILDVLDILVVAYFLFRIYLMLKKYYLEQPNLMHQL